MNSVLGTKEFGNSIRTFSPSPGFIDHRNQKQWQVRWNRLKAHGFGVDPADLCLEFCEANEQYHIEAPRVAHFAILLAHCLTRSSGEVCLYIA